MRHSFVLKEITIEKSTTGALFDCKKRAFTLLQLKYAPVNALFLQFFITLSERLNLFEREERVRPAAAGRIFFNS
jgi:hypothetical protein